MMPRNQLPDTARAAMHHEPQAGFVVLLQLQEMIAAAECAKLHSAITLGGAFEAIVAERKVSHSRWQFAALSMLVGRHESIKTGQNLCGVGVRSNERCIGLQCDCGHTAADVVSDRLRIDELPRRDDDAYANFARQMNVGHYRNMSDIVSVSQ
jgi:hypothetical protein